MLVNMNVSVSGVGFYVYKICLLHCAHHPKSNLPLSPYIRNTVLVFELLLEQITRDLVAYNDHGSFCHWARGWRSEIKVAAGLAPEARGSSVQAHFRLLRLLAILDISWLVATWLPSLPVFIGAFPVFQTSVSASGHQSSRMVSWRTLITSLTTLFPSKVTGQILELRTWIHHAYLCESHA